MSQGFCTNCGSALAAGTAFCPACGTPTQSAAAPAPVAPPPAAAAPTPAPAPVMPPPPGHASQPLPPPAPVMPPHGHSSQPLPPAWQQPAPASGGWQRWAFGAVGLVAIAAGLMQLGIIPSPGGRSSSSSGSGSGSGSTVNSVTASSPPSASAPAGAPPAASGAASLDGVWTAIFVVDGIVYTGRLPVMGGSGTMTVNYTLPSGPVRVQQSCSMAPGATVTVRCTNPVIEYGVQTYLADNFDLTPDGPNSLRGTTFATNGSTGTARFVR